MLSDWLLTCIVSSLNLQALTSLQNEPSYYFCLEVSHRLDDFLRVVESFLSPPCGQLTQTLFGKIWASRLSGVWWQARRLVTKAAFSCKQQPDGQGPCPKHSWLGLGVGREVLPASKYLLLYLHSNCSGHNETLKLHIKTWEVLQSQAWLGEGVPLDFPSALSLSLSEQLSSSFQRALKTSYYAGCTQSDACCNERCLCRDHQITQDSF